MVIMSEDKFYSFIVTLKEEDVKDVRVGFVTPTTTKFGNFKDLLSYNLPSIDNKEYDLTWMYTEGREMAVFTDQQFEFALMKMRGMVDYEFLVKLKQTSHPKPAAVTPHSPTQTPKASHKS